MPEDQQLIKEIMKGSQAAMEVLTRKYYQQIYAFVYRKVGNKELAYDLTQEIFIKMMQKLSLYKNTGSFKSWLYTLAVNHCRDYWRSKQHKEKEKETILDDAIENDKSNVPYIFEKKETRAQVKHAILQLPEMQREAIILRYYHDSTMKEIAEMTDANISTVKSRLKQGLEKLAKYLDRGEPYEKKNQRY